MSWVNKAPWGNLAHTKRLSSSLSGRRSQMIRSESGLWGTAKRPAETMFPDSSRSASFSGISVATPLSKSLLYTSCTSWGLTLKHPFVGGSGGMSWGTTSNIFSNASKWEPLRWSAGLMIPAFSGSDIRLGRTSIAQLISSDNCWSPGL